jgi:hypothetical protein
MCLNEKQPFYVFYVTALIEGNRFDCYPLIFSYYTMYH